MLLRADHYNECDDSKQYSPFLATCASIKRLMMLRYNGIELKKKDREEAIKLFEQSRVYAELHEDDDEDDD